MIKTLSSFFRFPTQEERAAAKAKRAAHRAKWHAERRAKEKLSQQYFNEAMDELDRYETASEGSRGQ